MLLEIGFVLPFQELRYYTCEYHAGFTAIVPAGIILSNILERQIDMKAFKQNT